MLVQKENQHIVHHLLGYECEETFDATPYIGGLECGKNSLPYELYSNCQTKMFIGFLFLLTVI